VRLINDVDLVSRINGSEESFITQITRIINEAMSCGIKFDNID
jgi:hypothetical protein